ncbi:MAG: tetratricopeptide repeat protein, partial [Thermodesulfobacteriota bacterium]
MKLTKRDCGFYIQILILALFILLFDRPGRADEINCQWVVNEPVKESTGEKYRKGYCYMKLGRFQEGLALLNGLKEQLPLIGDYALYYRGVGEMRTGNLPSAMELFNKILTDYPDSGLKKNLLLEVSSIYSTTGNYEKAENVYRSLYADESDQNAKSSFLNSIGDSQEGQKKYSEALTTYKQLWVQFPESRYADAALSKTFQISKTLGIPLVATESEYLQRAERLFKLSRWGSAVKEFERVSQTGEIRLKVAICKFRLGSFNEASALLSRIASAESLYWNAKISSKLGRDDEASQAYYQIYRLYPQSALAPEALYNGARLYHINSNFEKAIE